MYNFNSSSMYLELVTYRKTNLSETMAILVCPYFIQVLKRNAFLSGVHTVGYQITIYTDCYIQTSFFFNFPSISWPMSMIFQRTVHRSNLYLQICNKIVLLFGKNIDQCGAGLKGCPNSTTWHGSALYTAFHYSVFGLQ